MSRFVVYNIITSVCLLLYPLGCTCNQLKLYNPLDDCPTFVDKSIFYSSQQVVPCTPHRALQTLPASIFRIVPSSIPGAGLGVVARTFVARHTWLGEYEGEFLPVNRSELDHAWLIRNRDGHGVYYVDGYDVRTSNWLRYVNCARHVSEENVVASQCAGRMYYRTKRDLYPGQELLIYYGHGYARRLNIDVHNYYKT